MGRILTVFRFTAVLVATAAITGPAFANNALDGAKVFKSQCAMCHRTEKSAPPGVGPSLFGVVGSRAGALPGYRFSKRMKQSGLTWTPSELQLYLANPQKVVPGTKMPYAGLRNSSMLADLIAYLETLK